VDDAATLATIREVYRKWHYLLDPHSAVGVRAALDQAGSGLPTVAMGTAHPAKFGAAIRKAIGSDPPLPPALADLEGRPARVTVLPARADSVQNHIRGVLP
jgi:threonine synthase